MNERVKPYHKDATFEEIWERVNQKLLPLEKELIDQFTKPEYPIVLIAGTQRSGTTLLEQLIIESFEVGYIDNLTARFWQAPYLGALLTKELRRRKPQNTEPSFTSELGTTYGCEGPHEFGFFWDRWVYFEETHQLSEDQKEKIDVEFLLKELAAIESAYDAPLVFKNPLAFSLNIPFWAEAIPNSVFLITKRDTLYTAQSTLKSRLKRYDSKKKWWSIKPKEYNQLKELPYPEEIVGQILYTKERIEDTISLLSDHKYKTIQYSDLCAQPGKELNKIEQLISHNGFNLKQNDFSPEIFENRNFQQIEDKEFEQLKKALDKLRKTSSRNG